MTPAKIATMPSKGTTRRSIRIPDEEWDPFVAKAVREETDASDKIRKFVRADLSDEAHVHNLARIVGVLEEFEGKPGLSPDAERIIDAIRCVLPDWAIDQPLSAFGVVAE